MDFAGCDVVMEVMILKVAVAEANTLRYLQVK